MRREPVESSNIKSIGYDAQNRELHIEFKSGGVYSYHGVSPDEHESMMKADSIGSHFHKRIKPHYQHRKHDE